MIPEHWRHRRRVNRRATAAIGCAHAANNAATSSVSSIARGVLAALVLGQITHALQLRNSSAAFSMPSFSVTSTIEQPFAIGANPRCTR